MLATVATQTLNNDVSLRNIKTRPLSPQAEFKPDVKPFIVPVTSKSKPTSCRNPRRLTDFDVFGFQQVQDTSLGAPNLSGVLAQLVLSHDLSGLLEDFYTLFQS